MKKQKNITISIIIPAYNEASKITKDIREAFKYLTESGTSGEIIVSADGCTDNTLDIVNGLKKEYDNLVLINGGPRNGKGGAIKKGVEKAEGQYIMFADAGLCVPFKFIKDGIKKLEKRYDCALASRGSSKSVIIKAQPFYRKIGSKFFGLIVRNIIGVPQEIKDTQCGFKLYKKEVAKKLYKNLLTEKFMFDIEIILRAKKEKYKMAQFPVQWSNDADTKFNPVSGSITNIKDLLKIKILYRL